MQSRFRHGGPLRACANLPRAETSTAFLYRFGPPRSPPLHDLSIQAMAQYIYTMNRVWQGGAAEAHHPAGHLLSFFPGAKIGVLGLNGSGKSTLLRIMAGIDTEIEGEARPQPGIKIGFLSQEPQLDAAEGRARQRRWKASAAHPVADRPLQRGQRPVRRSRLDDEQMNKLLEEQAKLQDAIDAEGGWELERKLEVAADALRLPPWDADVTKISGGERRRVALCRLLLSQPDMLLLDEPTNHLDAESVAWLERLPRELSGHRDRGDARSLLPRQRRRLDPRARPRPRHPVAGQLLLVARAEGASASRIEEKQQEGLRKTLQRELEWVRANPKARQAKSKARLQRYEELASQEFQKRNETNEIYIPPGARLGELVIEAQGPEQGATATGC